MRRKGPGGSASVPSASCDRLHAPEVQPEQGLRGKLALERFPRSLKLKESFRSATDDFAPMRIGMVSCYCLDCLGGIEGWIEQVALRLRQRNAVSVITTDAGQRSVERVRTLAENGVSVHEIRRAYGLTPSPLDFPVLSRILEEQDVAYFAYWPGGLELATLLASHLSEVPVVVGYHLPMDPAKRIGAPPDTSVYHRFFGFKGIRIARRFKIHHAQDLDTVDFLRSHGFTDVNCIPCGVDLARYPVRSKFDEFTVLFLGRLEFQKGADRIPLIARSLTQRQLRFRLLVVGGGALERDLSRTPEPGVRLKGVVGDEEKLELLSRSHVLVMPSRWEGFPAAALEACASGTPIVGSPVGGLREIIVEGKSGFTASDPDQIGRRIETVYRMWLERAPYQELVETTKRSALRFDWDNVVPKLENLLVKAAGQ